VARGGRPAPEATLLVRGDRDEGGYDALDGQHWDEVVDVSSRARHVREAVAALGDRAAHWTYVSSMSVYDEDETIGLDETGRLLEPAQDGDEYDYGREKVAAELAVRTLGERAFIVRPGLIAGPGDPSDRFGYWTAAADRAGSGPILVPERGERFVQVIDVDDLAAFLAVEGRRGIVNANGDVHSFQDVLGRIRALTGHAGALVEAPDAWLEQQGVQHWMGERSLPLWLPAGMPGFTRRSNDGYRAAGGVLRPLDETIRRVRDDELARGVDRERRSGLSRSEELALIDAWRTAGADAR